MENDTVDLNIVVPRILLFLSLALYCVALFGPAFHYDGGSVSGWYALGIGWFPAIVYLFGIPGMLLNSGHHQEDLLFIGHLCWFANPLLLFAWMAQFGGARRFCLGFAISAFLFGLLFPLLKDIHTSESSVMSNVHPGIGCWLWYGSMVVTILSGLLLSPKEKLLRRME